VPAFVLYSFALFVVAFGVLRNLPIGAPLAPGRLFGDL
jgi:hypothetical protein